jgi:hypothetical protein
MKSWPALLAIVRGLLGQDTSGTWYTSVSPLRRVKLISVEMVGQPLLAAVSGEVFEHRRGSRQDRTPHEHTDDVNGPDVPTIEGDPGFSV